MLKSSLQGWRDHYCDSQDRWLECARYQMSLTGERVPISLLPNGHQALHLASQANWSGTVAEAQAPRRAPRQEAAQEALSDFRREFREEPPMSDPRSRDTVHRFEPALPPVTPRHRQPSQQTQSPQPQDRPAGHSRRAAKRGLWARLVDWMTSPS
ncbi:hypothetical protein [Streptomyces meridianus]|uniref:Uncharacterized protein n=1 Tax=Streptomyces meridianus TaxID=2938945 RepID=A0ABT0XAQ6_9ACTN|nr:hypothetical protein [Streptomyces meridianus]MCM2579375.1 hypothetical protein [Streptomyces meridianus]